MTDYRTTEPMEIDVYPPKWWERPLIWLRLRRGPLRKATDSIPFVVGHRVTIKMHGGAYAQPEVTPRTFVDSGVVLFIGDSENRTAFFERKIWNKNSFGWMR